MAKNRLVDVRLVELVEERWEDITGSSKKLQIEQAKRDAWKAVCNALNSEFSLSLQTEYVQRHWSYIRSRAKNANLSEKKYASQTGGGPPQKKDSDAVVIGFLGETPSFAGIDTPAESSIFQRSRTPTSSPFDSVRKKK